MLNGRSLTVLSTMIDSAVKLAMHLNLSESAVTGLKFDCVANGRGREELTYRVLLLWKRSTAGLQRDSQVGGTVLLLIHSKAEQGSCLAETQRNRALKSRNVAERCSEILSTKY